MMVDKLGGLNPLNNIQNSRRTNAPSKYSAVSDTISVSKEAQRMAEAYYLKEIADETPDVRSDLVAQIKEKIKAPNYLSPANISSAADRILAEYGL